MARNPGSLEELRVEGEAEAAVGAEEPGRVGVRHFRNLYQKVGMFGIAPHPGFPNTDHSEMGEQVRGFGFLHDGSMDTLFRFQLCRLF